MLHLLIRMVPQIWRRFQCCTVPCEAQGLAKLTGALFSESGGGGGGDGGVVAVYRGEYGAS